MSSSREKYPRTRSHTPHLLHPSDSQFCTKKLHRLRQGLHLTHKDPQRDLKAPGTKGSKSKGRKKKQTAVTQSAADKAKGGNVYTEKTIETTKITSDRPAQLLLFEAERAWAHSQDLRTQSNAEGEDPALRRRSIGRAKRAVGWSADLSTLIESLADRVDIQSKAEVVAYALSIKGSADFDKGDWDSCLEHLSVARLVLTALARDSADSRGEALANSFVDAGEAQMRYCAYQLGEEQQDMDKVAEETATSDVRARVCPSYGELVKKLDAYKAAQGSTKEASEAVEIAWRDRTVPIRHPELMDAVTRVRRQESALKETLQNRQSNDQAISTDKQAKNRKPVRLSHAERNARKRGGEVKVGETSATAASRQSIGSSSRSGNDPFDHALAALTDGELTARRLVDDNAEALSKSHSTRYEAVGEDLKVAHEWLQYRLLSLQITRSTRLAEEVEAKAEKREKRKREALQKTSSANGQSKQKTTPASGKRAAKKGESIRPKKDANKKAQSGSRSKKARTGSATHHRRPARSGTKRLHAVKDQARAARVHLQSRRRSARVVPALAKLLDSSEHNLVVIAGLSVIESDPDASSVIDAKAAWYRAELLRQLARAYSLDNQREEACLLLRRAALSVRQARQALDLVEERSVAQEMDDDISPVLTGDLFDHTDVEIESLLRQVQRDGFFAVKQSRRSAKGKSNASAPSRGKAGQQLRLLATKHVDFDPMDMAEASRPDPAYEAELQEELAGSGGKAPTKSTATTVASKAKQQVESIVKATTASSSARRPSVPDPDDDDQFHEAGEDDDEDHEEDDEFAPAEQDESDEEEATQQQAGEKKGWFGGWLGGGRK